MVLLLAGASSIAGEQECIAESASRFGLPASLVRAIRTVEGGRVGQANRNLNGTVDVGPMQINSLWAPTLARRGVGFDNLRWHECTNILIASWILARELKQGREDGAEAFWRAVGNYHSRTPEHNRRYAVKVWRAWREESRRAGSVDKRK